MLKARRRFHENWVSIVLTVISIIQGLAFNNLIVKFPEIYSHTLSSGNYVIIAHFILCFVVLLRLFQTYISAALDYDEWTIGVFDIFLIFIIGAIEYFVFSSLEASNFDISEFHRRISIISILGIIGYLGAFLRLKEEYFPSYFYYRREIRLQGVNVLGVLLVQVISITIIYVPFQDPFIHTILATLASVILLFNIYFSVKTTFYPGVHARKATDHDLIVKASEKETQNCLEVLIKPAERQDMLDILELMMANFAYVYSSLFDTSNKLTRRILEKVILVNGGKGLIGYRKFHLAFSKHDGNCVGLVLLANKESQNFSTKISTTLSILIALRFLGVIGLLRSVRNMKKIKTAMPDFKNEEMYVTYVAVSQPHQKQGVGKQLLDYGQALGKSMGYKHLALDVRETNENAQRFFIGQGFQIEMILESDSDDIFGMGKRIKMRKTI